METESPRGKSCAKAEKVLDFSFYVQNYAKVTGTIIQNSAM